MSKNPSKAPEDLVAIVGMGLSVPGANSPDELWQNVLDNKTFFTPAEKKNWGADPAYFYDKKSNASYDKTYSLNGAFNQTRTLSNIKLPEDLNLENADSSLIYWLAAGLRAAEDFGWENVNAEKAAIISGHVILPTTAMAETTLSIYGNEAVKDWGVDIFNPPSKNDSFKVIGYSAEFLAKALQIKGPAYTVDAACASSLYAISLAIKSLLDGSLDLVISGGVAAADALFTQLGFSQLKALSRKGQLTPFSKKADGLVVGEGAAALVLKRLDKALEDKNKIYAVISGYGLSNDQSGNLLSPNPEGQLQSMRLAVKMAGIKGSDLDLIEAHGTGTPVGDKLELEAISNLLDENASTVVSSVKSNVGHLLSAAGAVAVIKTVIALKAKILPPTAGLSDENPQLEIFNNNLRILRKAEPWPETKGRPRIAAVNAFGFGGVNAQIILEEWNNKSVVLKAKPKIKKTDIDNSIYLLSASALLAPWNDFNMLARFWAGLENIPLLNQRQFGSIKAKGLFFDNLLIDGYPFKLTPKELGEALPQQVIPLQTTYNAMQHCGLSLDNWPNFIDKNKVGVFMGVNIDPRSSDYAFRWLAPIRVAEKLASLNIIKNKDIDLVTSVLKTHKPLTHSRVIGALGNLVASRIARYIQAGGPSFTICDAFRSGINALHTAFNFIKSGEIDLAFVGCVDTLGDPKTAFLNPKRLWEEGAAVLIVASSRLAQHFPNSQIIDILPEEEGKSFPLGGLLPLVKNSFYLKSRLKPQGIGNQHSYWLKYENEPERSLKALNIVIQEPKNYLPTELFVPNDNLAIDEWFLIRGTNNEEVKNNLIILEKLAQNNDPLKIVAKIFYNQQDKKQPPALAFFAKNIDDLHYILEKLKRYPEKIDSLKSKLLFAGKKLKGDLAWVFPGSGTHYHLMGKKLALEFPREMFALEKENTYLAEQFQINNFWYNSKRQSKATSSILAQVSFGLLGARVLRSYKIEPQAVLGYSLGETTSLVATGAWAERDELYLDLLNSTLFTKDLNDQYLAAKKYWKIPNEKNLSWLTGVLAISQQDLIKFLQNPKLKMKNKVFPLIVNTSEETVIGGEASYVRKLVEITKAHFYPLDGVSAVHNPTVSIVEKEYKKFHTRKLTPINNLRYYSSYNADYYPLSVESVAESLTSQALYGHDFVKLIKKAYQDGVRYFIEVGPGASLTRMINHILKNNDYFAGSLSPSVREEGKYGLKKLMVEMWLNNYPLSEELFYPQNEITTPLVPVDVNFEPLKLDWPKNIDELKNKLALSAETIEEVIEKHTEVIENIIEEPTEVMEQHTQNNIISNEGDNKALSAKKDEPTTKNTGEQDAYMSWLLSLTKNKENATPEITKLPPLETHSNEQNKKISFNREQCLAYAIGTISEVFGTEFAEVDNYPSRVRLPDEPLMFVDRVVALEGDALSMKSGRIVTEHDVLKNAWYLDNGHIPAGLSIESGQADLMLSAWLGADFETKGLAYYRLLDAEVTFHRDLPKVNETAKYDINISHFFKHANTTLFRFSFDAFIEGQPLLTMKNGCAGFFTPQELKSGKGIAIERAFGKDIHTKNNFDDFIFSSLKAFKPLDSDKLNYLRQGQLHKAFGASFKNLDVKNPLTIPGGKLSLIDRVVEIDPNGGHYGSGFIMAEMDIDSDAWFLTSHFKGDEVMPGTLMYESCLYSLRVYLLYMGWIGDSSQVDWQPLLNFPASLKCRGQVTAETKVASYTLHIKEIGLTKNDAEPYAVADAIMFADGKAIVEVNNLGLRLKGATLDSLKKSWNLNSKIETKTKKSKNNFEFTKEQLLTVATGRLSDVFGSHYSKFDDGSFVARLPGPPYDLIDSITVFSPPNQVVQGANAEAIFSPNYSSWLFTKAGGGDYLPYAALNEIALQPCGFLAAYMGSALGADVDMHFRNLGGEAKVYRQIIGGETIKTNVQLTKSSQTGGMIIQHYDFQVTGENDLIYEGKTHFGFFSPDSLQKQEGLKVDPQTLKIWDCDYAKVFKYPIGYNWPKGQWRMVEQIKIDPSGGDNNLGLAMGICAVNPKAWFFKAHFFQDPVWPGSLGIEGFLQVAKTLAEAKLSDSGKFGRRTRVSWEAPSLGVHKWLYRGQITPNNKEVKILVKATEINTNENMIKVDGFIVVDDLPIYQLQDFTIVIKEVPEFD